MKLCNKYNIPQETLDKMVKDGILSCAWPRYEEVYAAYQALLNKGLSKEKMYSKVADQKHMSPRTVKFIVSVMDKI